MKEKTKNSTQLKISNYTITNNQNEDSKNVNFKKAKSEEENEKQRIKEKLLNKKNLNNLNKIFASRILHQSISTVKSLKTDITIHSDSPDGYVNEKVNFELKKGKMNKIVKKFSLGGTSDKLHSFRISSSYVYF